MILVFFENMQLHADKILVGSLLVLSSAMVFAGFLMGSALMIKRIGATRFTAYSMSFACLATLSHFFIAHGLTFPELPAYIYWLAFLMAMFSTVLPAFCMNTGIQHMGAGNAAIISSAGPVGTLILAFFILHENITIIQMTGTVLVLIGVYVISRNKN